MKHLLSILRSVSAVFAGYLVIALGTTLTFEVWLGGIGYFESSPAILVLATLGALVSGIVGGLLAASLAGHDPFGHGLAIVFPIGLDTFYVVASGISPDPVWFDLGGAFVLVAGAAVGAYLYQRFKGSPPSASIPRALPQN